MAKNAQCIISVSFCEGKKLNWLRGFRFKIQQRSVLLGSDQEEELLGSCFSLRYTFWPSLELQHLNSPAADIHSSARNRDLGQYTFHFDSLWGTPLIYLCLTHF